MEAQTTVSNSTECGLVQKVYTLSGVTFSFNRRRREENGEEVILNVAVEKYFSHYIVSSVAKLRNVCPKFTLGRQQRFLLGTKTFSCF